MRKPALSFPKTPQKRLRLSNKGQTIVEYAGMIVLSTLMVGGMMSGTKQVMPVFFTLLSQRNAAALSDDAPLPAASFPSPAPASSTASNTGPSTSNIIPVEPQPTLPSPVTAPFQPDINIQSAPTLAMSERQPETAATIQPSSSMGLTLDNLAAHPTPPPRIAAEPSPAPEPRIAPGPSPAPPPRIAPPPTPAS